MATIDRTIALPSEVDDCTPYIGLESINRWGRYLSAISTVGESEISSAKFRFNEHHVPVGENFAPTSQRLHDRTLVDVCSTDILPISPGMNLDRDYLDHFLLLPSTIALATVRAIGANLPRLSTQGTCEVPVPLPPVDEQRRIARYLDTVDALRAKRREAIALLDDLAQSIFLNMFGDHERAGMR